MCQGDKSGLLTQFYDGVQKGQVDAEAFKIQLQKINEDEQLTYYEWSDKSGAPTGFVTFDPAAASQSNLTKKRPCEIVASRDSKSSKRKQ